MSLRVVTYDFTVEQEDIGVLDRLIRESAVANIASDIEEVGISDPDDEGDISDGDDD
jgi:hypothetical protein